MQFIIFLSMVFLTSCGSFPQLFQAAEDIADDKAIDVMISREAIQKQTDVTISVDVRNNMNSTK